MARRGQNEGSIYRRNDGRWAAAISLGYRNGRRYRKAFYGKTRKEVQERLTAALRSHEQGLAVAPERQTVRQFLEAWLEESAKPNLRPRTYEGYAGHVHAHIVPVLGHIRLARLTPPAVQGFLNQKRQEGYAPRTIQYMHAVLRRALGQAYRWGLVAQNVATLVERPKAARQEVQPLSPEQARALLAAVQGDRLEALYSVALAVGLRKGEALGLSWDDLDLEAGTLRVRAALQRVNGKLQLVEPKTDRSRRTIALPQSAIVSLRKHRVRQMQERLLAGSRWEETGLVFTTTIGTPIDPRNVTRHFKNVLKKGALSEKRFHDLRHTCASLLLVQGVHPRVVMEVLGHSQISMTMDTYSHVMPVLQRHAAAQIDALLGAQS
jgi:integrase